MARKLRLQFEGAIYHVINRGNYRRSLCETESTKHAFRNCLLEATEFAGWRLHAYALMTNHFHLVLETPRGNLVEGMHWLQTTFATRFNRLRKENGHLFQGRYRAILVEPGPSLARVVNYVHLNPVRAGLANIDELKTYPWTSLGFFLGSTRPPSLVCSDWLRELGLQDRPPDWSRYLVFLQHLAADTHLQIEHGFSAMTHGWAIGTDEWRSDLVRKHRGLSLNRGYRPAEVADLKSLQWRTALETLKRKSNSVALDPKTAPKGAPWKIALAWAMRSDTTAPLSWIAAELHMGTAGSLSHYLYLVRRGTLKISDLRT